MHTRTIDGDRNSVRQTLQRGISRPKNRETRVDKSHTNQQTDRSCQAETEPPLQRLQRTHGNRVVQRLVKEDIQPKLNVSPPNDRYEREADRVARAVTRKPVSDRHHTSHTTARTARKHVQRMCRPCRKRHAAGKSLDCPECEGELQRTETAAAIPTVDAETTTLIQESRRGGRPLPASVRSYFGPQFGHEFGDVRVHTGSKADEAARAVNAKAFTLGRDIVFRSGAYRPHADTGRYLLAHELTHTVQQSDATEPMRVQRMAECPPALARSDPVPSGWKEYQGDPCVFHCCYRGILEDRQPTPDDPQNECFYDNAGRLVDEDHPRADCGGSPNQYDSKSDPIKHALIDEGGIVSKGWGAFWESRGKELEETKDEFTHEMGKAFDWRNWYRAFGGW